LSTILPCCVSVCHKCQAWHELGSLFINTRPHKTSIFSWTWGTWCLKCVICIFWHNECFRRGWGAY
jgi:hypothetical protein